MNGKQKEVLSDSSQRDSTRVKTRIQNQNQYYGQPVIYESSEGVEEKDNNDDSDYKGK